MHETIVGNAAHERYVCDACGLVGLTPGKIEAPAMCTLKGWRTLRHAAGDGCGRMSQSQTLHLCPGCYGDGASELTRQGQAAICCAARTIAVFLASRRRRTEAEVNSWWGR